MSTFEEGLGRVMYVFGALKYGRPFPRTPVEVRESANVRFGAQSAVIHTRGVRELSLNCLFAGGNIN